MNPNLKDLCRMYENIESQLKLRHAKLSELEAQIKSFLDALPASVQDDIDFLPDSIKVTRQRISRDKEAEISVNMRIQAHNLMTFTKPQLTERMQILFPDVSFNIINRIFDDQNYTSEGRVDGVRGRPHLYSCSCGKTNTAPCTGEE